MELQEVETTETKKEIINDTINETINEEIINNETTDMKSKEGINFQIFFFVKPKKLTKKRKEIKFNIYHLIFIILIVIESIMIIILSFLSIIFTAFMYSRHNLFFSITTIVLVIFLLFFTIIGVL
jgi:hypothetical protein